jgi:hypothetical protein
MGMSVEGVTVLVTLASLLVPALAAAAFWHVRVYSIYRLLGEHWPEIEQQRLQERRQLQPVRRVSIPKPAGDLSYYWFSREFANPWLAKQLPGYVDLFCCLPQDMAAQVSIVRRHTRRAELIVTCCALLVVIVFLGFVFRWF